ncbi:hypothetical protein [Fluviicola taffensis]|uniref:Uncharacterized protein n=1 Tax=Fluviicola taffensis (strain DSM 16823 / NCIMB 13979 / RW262) TaxID=755732 RepID=F2IAW1_FLUTR|nr:hypothetical protein [Fluviicola taffensis]AEA45285.1 hypothetical protein Fluta_3313 [Fluviicola taffensis DSM 16823]
MIKTILSVGFFLCLGISYGQQTTKPPMKQVASDQTPPPLTKEMEVYAAKNGTYIIVRSEGKKLTPDGEVTLEKAKLVDPKEIGVKIINKTQYFTIAGTNDLLVVKSTWILDNEMKNSNR